MGRDTKKKGHTWQHKHGKGIHAESIHTEGKHMERGHTWRGDIVRSGNAWRGDTHGERTYYGVKTYLQVET